MAESPVLVATSHGTDSPAGREAIAALVDAVRSRLPDVEVVAAFVDVEQPYVGDVVAQSARPCVVVPLLLSPGFHIHGDITQAVRGGGHVAAATMGPDERLANVMADRLLAVGAIGDDTVILAAAGSTDERARDATVAMAAMLSRRWGRHVPVGHLGGTGRPLADVMAERRDGGGRLVLASYLLAPGHFDDIAVASGAEIVARPLLEGPVADERIVDLVADRFWSAVSLHSSQAGTAQ